MKSLQKVSRVLDCFSLDGVVLFDLDVPRHVQWLVTGYMLSSQGKAIILTHRVSVNGEY